MYYSVHKWHSATFLQILYSIYTVFWIHQNNLYVDETPLPSARSHVSPLRLPTPSASGGTGREGRSLQDTGGSWSGLGHSGDVRLSHGDLTISDASLNFRWCLFHILRSRWRWLNRQKRDSLCGKSRGKGLVKNILFKLHKMVIYQPFLKLEKLFNVIWSKLVVALRTAWVCI